MYRFWRYVTGKNLSYKQDPSTMKKLKICDREKPAIQTRPVYYEKTDYFSALIGILKCSNLIAVFVNFISLFLFGKLICEKPLAFQMTVQNINCHLNGFLFVLS